MRRRNNVTWQRGPRRLVVAALALVAGTACQAAAAKTQSAAPRKTTPPSVTAARVVASPSPAERAGEIVFAAVGDVMLGSTYPDESGGSLPPDDGVGVLADVAPLLGAADVTFGNLEGPLIDGGTSTKCPRKSNKCYAFRVPMRYGQHLKAAGFDVMSLANNHAMDFGAAGRDSSKKVLDELGIAHSGEVGDIARLSVRGHRLAVIAFATSPFSYHLNDLSAARARVAELAAHNDIVVVSFHGGAEGAAHQRVPIGHEFFYREDRGDLRTFAHEMIDAGADLVIGHGPHVLRGLELYQGRLVAYSLGNFATYGGMNLRGAAGLCAILEAHVASDGAFRGGRLHACRQRAPGGPERDATGEAIGVVRALSTQDFGAAAPTIGDDGSLAAP